MIAVVQALVLLLAATEGQVRIAQPRLLLTLVPAWKSAGAIPRFSIAGEALAYLLAMIAEVPVVGNRKTPVVAAEPEVD